MTFTRKPLQPNLLGIRGDVLDQADTFVFPVDRKADELSAVG